MPNPFPGMNPYLEHPEFWPEVHHLLISIIQESLVPQLLPKYYIAIEKRIYEIKGEESVLVGIPDLSVQRRQTQQRSSISANVAVAAPPIPLKVGLPMLEEVREGYLEVREIATKEVVTVIEVLSPANKRPGKGREMYEEKRDNIFKSRTNLVEIDLLREAEPLPAIAPDDISASYRILVSRRNERPLADLYLFNLPDTIPAFPLPLRAEDSEPTVDLQGLLNTIYDRAGCDFRIDYAAKIAAPLSESDAIWADVLLRERGLRE